MIHVLRGRATILFAGICLAALVSVNLVEGG